MVAALGGRKACAHMQDGDTAYNLEIENKNFVLYASKPDTSHIPKNSLQSGLELKICVEVRIANTIRTRNLML